jgi:hypothetical protein
MKSEFKNQMLFPQHELQPQKLQIALEGTAVLVMLFTTA